MTVVMDDLTATRWFLTYSSTSVMTNHYVLSKTNATRKCSSEVLIVYYNSIMMGISIQLVLHVIYYHYNDRFVITSFVEASVCI